MNLKLRSRKVHVTQELRRHIETRLAFALARFGHRVRGILVHLSDVNGPRGGEDIHCRVEALLSPGGSLQIEETSCDPFQAVARASNRMSQRLGRHLKRVQSRRRGR